MSAPKETTNVASEQILSAKTDLCISNGIVKAGLGLAGGVVASAILFKRRPWPVLVGLGFGLGQGYSDCERVFNPAAIPGFRIATDPAKPASSAYANFAPLSANLKEKAAEVKAAVVGKGEELKAKGEAVVAKGEAKAEKAEAKVEKKAEEVKAELKDGKKWV